jgi:hypothetical protein
VKHATGRKTAGGKVPDEGHEALATPMKRKANSPPAGEARDGKIAKGDDPASPKGCKAIDEGHRSGEDKSGRGKGEDVLGDQRQARDDAIDN